MVFNSIKKYSDLLELGYLSEKDRKNSLQEIFDRDIKNNSNFSFRSLIIRPHKSIDGAVDFESLFDHLTNFSTSVEENGVVVKSRNNFDIRRSERLHWIKYHLEENAPAKIDIFSHKDKVQKRKVIRTYIFDETENYVIILEPQRSGLDYYLITAYYLSEKLGGPDQIKNKRKRRLPQVY